METYTLLHGKCEEVLKTLPDNSVDAVVTDPPYEIGFMSKGWDNSGVANSDEMWREVFRVLKPGGHLLSFGATRTYHRMACAIEDAGFEIRDAIHWAYGTGFPKSRDISKDVDKVLGEEREVVGSYKVPGYAESNVAHKTQTRNKLEFDIKSKDAISDEAKKWQGWGTALKPAYEPIVLARKPVSEKTIVENVLKWGTGAMNIDATRIPTSDTLGGGGEKNATFAKKEGWDRPWMNNAEKVAAHSAKVRENVLKAEELGRFPSNIILDAYAARQIDEQSGISPARKGKSGVPRTNNGRDVYGTYDGESMMTSHDTPEGGASRYFKLIQYDPETQNPIYYCTKPGDKERREGLDYKNPHPTVKPVQLMRYLVRLVTPEGGTVLDPFGGSGSTGVASILEGFHPILIEMTDEYLPIIESRLQHASSEDRAYGSVLAPGNASPDTTSPFLEF